VLDPAGAQCESDDSGNADPLGGKRDDLPLVQQAVRRYPEAAIITCLIVVTSLAVLFRWYYDNWIAELDIFTTFLPNMSYMGSRLSQFEIPAWNPYASSGMPMAGDSQGGWWYFPAMIAFALLNPLLAMKTMVLIQTLIGAVALYFFARKVGLHSIPALAVGLAHGIGPMLYSATFSVTVEGQINAFLPVALLGIESALQSRRLSSRLGWAVLAGIGFSHLFNSWPGQGTMYGAMIIAGWMGWRLVVEPAVASGPFRLRLQWSVVIGAVFALATLGFGAAGILPRLDFNEQSNVPGGDYSNAPGSDYRSAPWAFSRTLLALLQDQFSQRSFVIGSAVIILAFLAVFRFRHRFGVHFWAICAEMLVDLATDGSIFRTILGIVPQFEHLHGHAPQRSIWVLSIPMAMLAGAGLQYLLDRDWPRVPIAWGLAPIGLYTIMYIYVEGPTYEIGFWPFIFAAITAVVLVVATSPLVSRIGTPVIAAALLLLIVAYPTLTDFARTIRDPESGVNPDGSHYSRPLGTDENTKDKIETVLGLKEPDGAAAFLQAQAEKGAPFRYVVYAGWGYNGSFSPYIVRRMSNYLILALTNNRSHYLELADVSSYNPIHLMFYMDYIEGINGETHDYHYNDIYGAAIGTNQLLDMLNTRYVIVTNDIPQDREDVAHIYASMPVVYQDNRVTIFENPNAFERAWVVHDVQPGTDDAALAAFAANTADGNITAFVDGEVPPTSGPIDEEHDNVVFVQDEPELLAMKVYSHGNGLLVASIPFDSNWNAYVDGKQVDILRTDHALLGVPLTSGTKDVELRYESAPLRNGLLISGASSVLIAGIWCWALIDRRRNMPEVTAEPEQATAG